MSDLKASYFAAAKPGPGVLLLHQSNRTRDSWDGVAQQLAAAGINTLTVDNRGHGESGGTYDAWADPDRKQAKEKWLDDLDTAFQFLVSQPGVERDVIGVGGAGVLGVNNSVEAARRHPAPGEIARFAFGRDLSGWLAIPAGSVATARSVRCG
jgi:predicted acyl esterase